MAQPKTWQEAQNEAPPSSPWAGLRDGIAEEGVVTDVIGNERALPFVLAQSAVAVSLTGTTTETALATVTVPAGVIGANGQVEIITLWTHTSSANNKSLRVRLGGMGGTGVLAAAATTTASTQALNRFANRNSQASQVAYNGGIFAPFGNTSGALSVSAVDTSADTTIVITGALASAAETVTLESYIIKVYPRS